MTALLGKEVNKSLVLLLEMFDPQLLEEWSGVYQLKGQYQDELARLHALLRSRQEVGGVLCRSEQVNMPESFWRWLTEFAHEVIQFKQIRGGADVKRFLGRKEVKLSIISAGLSFMQFIAIAEILGASITNVDLQTIPILLVSGAAALSITFGSKEALIRWVKATRRGSDSSSLMPFWKRLLSGDTLTFCTIAIVLMEMTFTVPGMLSLLPPRLAAQLLPQISAYLASGLAAFVNVFLAHGIGMEFLELEKSLQKVEAKIEPINHSPKYLHIDPSFARMIRSNYQREVIEQRQLVERARRRYEAAYRRWKRSVKKLQRRKEVRQYLNSKYSL